MERYQKCVCKSRETIPLITHFFVFPELFSGRRRGKRGVSRNQGSQINQIGDEKLVMNQDLDDTKKNLFLLFRNDFLHRKRGATF
jgi:hypothetical protein